MASRSNREVVERSDNLSRDSALPSEKSVERDEITVEGSVDEGRRLHAYMRRLLDAGNYAHACPIVSFSGPMGRCANSARLIQYGPSVRPASGLAEEIAAS